MNWFSNIVVSIGALISMVLGGHQQVITNDVPISASSSAEVVQHTTGISSYATSSTVSNVVSPSNTNLAQPITTNKSSSSLKTFDSSSIPYQADYFSFKYPTDWQIGTQSSSGVTLSKGTSKIALLMNNDNPDGTKQFYSERFTVSGSKNINGNDVLYFTQSSDNGHPGLILKTYFLTSIYQNKRSILFSLYSDSNDDVGVLENIISSFKIIPVPKVIIPSTETGQVIITSPIASDIFQAGKAYPVTWKGEVSSGVKYLVYLYDALNGNVVKTYLGSTVSNQETFTFTLPPNCPPTNSGYQIYLLNASDNSVITSTQTFTIVAEPSAPSLTVTYPTTSSVLSMGQSYNVTWANPPSQQVNYSVYLQNEAGVGVSSLYLGSVSSDKQTFVFKVPSNVQPSNMFKIYLMYASNGNVITSSPTFSITSQ